MSDKNNRPVTIGVAGGTGSGKTTVSNQILDRVGSKHIAYFGNVTLET
jgi:uridine kinase